MKATIFHKPHGRQQVIDLVNIHPADAEWFMANGVKVSLETGTTENEYILYADVGRKSEDGEPDEVIEICRTTCEEGMAKLRAGCEEALKEKDQWPTP